jgi:hypothetical protein
MEGDSRSDAVLAAQGGASLRAEPWVGIALEFYSPERAEYIALSGLIIFSLSSPRVPLRFTLGCEYFVASGLSRATHFLSYIKLIS